jgi:ketosteroid isomerase-like protein
MSQEDVDVVARFYEPATSKRAILDAMPRTMELCHPEIEWTTREDGMTYRGHEGVKEALERWLDSFDEYAFEVRRVIDCGEGDVLVIGLETGRGATSGAEVRSVNHELLTIRDGLIVRYREFFNERDALEAARLQT